MAPAHAQSVAAQHAPRVARIGCVSYLNAKPLIEGLEALADPTVRFDVPSRLLNDLEAGQVDIALCPVVDFFRSKTELVIVPVGGIGCEGPTLTVRLFSRVPLAEVTHVHADADSHTSVILMRVLLNERYGLRPAVIDYDAREQIADNRLTTDPQAVLLIGDKVVTSAPPPRRYPHQIDLGQAWNELTGLPFVFAVWMARKGAWLGHLPRLLEQARLDNSTRIESIVARHAAAHGWPAELAQQYLGHYLRYAVGDRELRAIAHFATLARKLNVIAGDRALRIYSAAEPQ